MKLYLKIFEFFLNSSIWVAITVSALVEITCVDIGVKTSVFLRFFIFLGTIFGYNFIKYFEKTHLSVIHPKVLKVDLITIRKRFKGLQLQEKATFLLSVFSTISCCVFSFKLNYETLVLLCVPALLSFFYAVSYGGKTLRSTSGLKIYVVGVVWAIVTVILPVVDAKIDIDYDVWITFVQRVIFVVVLILPFEIRDLSVDDLSLGTLPQKIGVQKTKLLGAVLLLIFLLLEFFKDEVLELNVVVLPVIFIVTLFFLINSSVKQSKYYASFFVEGIPIIWLLLLLVL